MRTLPLGTQGTRRQQMLSSNCTVPPPPPLASPDTPVSVVHASAAASYNHVRLSIIATLQQLCLPP